MTRADRGRLLESLEKLDPIEGRAMAEEGFGDQADHEGTLLAWLQYWYLRHCDDDWEHSYGVSIDTLDNPGWSVRIDLKGTSLEGRGLARQQIERSESDWIHWWVADGKFEGAGGPQNLTDILLAFRTWAESGQA